MHVKEVIRPARHFNKISFYIIAHADDWQLFMFPHVYKDITAPDCKVIFIVTTAGDSGRSETFWMAREEGLKSSIRFCIAPLSAREELVGESKFNNKTIFFCAINNTTTYFLRLPDGNLDGRGFSACNFQSLSLFKLEQINSISAINYSATYKSWSELVSLLESIIAFECKGLSNLRIHYINPNIIINPNDHPDHIATGNIIQNIAAINRLHRLLFVGYSSIASGEILALTDLFWKTSLFAAYEKAVYDNCGYSTLAENPELYFKLCCRKPNFTTAEPTVEKLKV